MEVCMSKILITGAAGFIGSQLAYELWKKNEDIVLIDNFSYAKEDNLEFELHNFKEDILNIDIRDRTSLYELFRTEKFDYVYHLAAITPLPDCQLNPGEAIEVNVAATVNILEASRIYGVRNVIFTSTSAVYENCTSFPTAEKDYVSPSLIYSSGKYAAEQFCKNYADVYNMNVTVLRFANVYGPHLNCLRLQPPVVGYIIRELFYERVPILHSNGEQRRDFIYSGDLIELAIKVMDNTGFDIINVSTGKSCSINEIYNIIADLMNKDNIRPEYTNAINYWNNYPGLYEGAYPIKENILEHEVNKFTECDNSHAINKYNWKPSTNLQEGLEKTVEFTCNLLKSLK